MAQLRRNPRDRLKTNPSLNHVGEGFVLTNDVNFAAGAGSRGRDETRVRIPELTRISDWSLTEIPQIGALVGGIIDG